MRVTIIIDAFRAFTTACYVLEKKPASYILTTKSSVIAQLFSQMTEAVTIGKAEKGADFAYTISNSPTRVLETDIAGRNVLHRTAAGAKGILLAKNTDIVLAAGFVNAEATARYIKELNYEHIEIMPMGHEGETPSAEDDLCATYIQTLINGKEMALTAFIPQLREGPGRYFFTGDQKQYPQEDFERCLETGRFNFAIQAILKGDYALLKRCDEPEQKSATEAPI